MRAKYLKKLHIFLLTLPEGVVNFNDYAAAYRHTKSLFSPVERDCSARAVKKLSECRDETAKTARIFRQG
jgi:hypothetical protein